MNDLGTKRMALPIGAPWGGSPRGLVDGLDIRILRELVQGGTVWPANPGLASSHRALARKLGVSAGTVRNRVLRMTRSGFLRGIQIYVNPSALGLVSGSYTLETPQGSSRHQVIARLTQIGGVVFFENFHGPLLGLGVFSEDDEKMEQLLSEVDATAKCARGVYTRVHHPPCSIRPNAAEWELIAHIVPEGFRSFQELSVDLNVPIRTLKRRLSRLVGGGALLTFPRMDYGALDSGVTAELLVVYHPGPSKDQAREAVIRQLDPWMTYAGTWEEFEVYRLILPSLSMATRLSDSLSRTPGTQLCRMELVDELSDHFEALLPYVARARRALAPSPPKGPPARKAPLRRPIRPTVRTSRRRG